MSRNGRPKRHEPFGGLTRNASGRPNWDFPWAPEDPCPCGRPARFGECCLQPDGRPYPKPGSLLPPGAPTGFAHPRCYLSGSNNCSTTLSREHFVSRSLIAGPELKVQGMPWQKVPVLHISPDALTAKVLCRRHNEALSPLDSEALRAFEGLRTARVHATRRSLSTRSWATIVSGQALELWALKTMAGFCASGMDFEFGGHRLSDFDLPLAEIASILTDPAPRSIVSLDIPGDMDAHEKTLGRSAVTILWEVDTAAHRLSAMVVRMQGIGFKFHLKPTGAARDGDSFVRPHILDVIGPKRKSRLYLGWPELTPGRYVFFRLKGDAPTKPGAPAGTSSDPAGATRSGGGRAVGARRLTPRERRGEGPE